MNTRSSLQRGLTMIELLVVVAVAGIIVITLAIFVGRSFNISREQFEQVRITEDARKEIERIADTVRNANNILDAQGTAQERWLVGAGNYDLTVYTDTDGDGDLEQVTYALAEGSTDLTRTVADVGGGNPATVTLVRTVRNRVLGAATPLFTYYEFGAAGQAAQLSPPSDTEGLSVANMSQVVRVGIRLVIDVNEQQRPDAVNITTDVTPRVVTAGDGQPAPTDTPPPGTPECNDGIDNDGDGYTDWPEDPGCYYPDPSDPQNDDNEGDNPVPPTGTPACRDGIDNDGDLKTDYVGEDPGCASADDTSEYGWQQCDNGIDDDGDGYTDWLEDTNCVSRTDDSEYNPCSTLTPLQLTPTGVQVLPQPSLDVNDCPYPYLGTAGGGYSDSYVFSGTAGQRIQASMESFGEAPDDAPALYLFKQGDSIAQQFSSSCDAAMTACLPNNMLASGNILLPSSGNYILTATSANADATFPYSLFLREYVCTATPLAMDSTISDSLTTMDCRLSPDFLHNVDLYTFSGTADQKVQITMEATSAGTNYPQLHLERSNGANVASSAWPTGCSGEFTFNKTCLPTNLTMGGSITLPANDTYTIVATSAWGATFDYNITLEEHQPIACSNTTVPLSTTPHTEYGTLGVGDCFYEDPPGTPTGRFADLFTFDGNAGDEVQISMLDSEYSYSKYPHLYLKHPTLGILAENMLCSIGSGIHACIPPELNPYDPNDPDTFTLPQDGTYTIVATFEYEDTAGDYELTVQKIVPAPAGEPGDGDGDGPPASGDGDDDGGGRWGGWSCPAAYLTADNGAVIYQQNILKGRIAASVEGTTHERLRTQSLPSSAAITIQEVPGDVTYLDALHLLALQHAQGTEAYIDQHGEAYAVVPGEPMGYTQKNTDGHDTYTIATHGAQGVLLTASLTEAITHELRATLSGEDRLQCVPGVYELADTLPAAAVHNVAATFAGIVVTDQEGQTLTPFPVVLERGETTLLTLPAGTDSITLTTPAGGYDIRAVRAAINLNSVAKVDRYQPVNNDTVAAVDGVRQRITGTQPATVVFEPTPDADTKVTYYLESTGYYHYGEEATCDAPSLKYDTIWQLLREAQPAPFK